VVLCIYPQKPQLNCTPHQTGAVFQGTGKGMAFHTRGLPVSFPKDHEGTTPDKLASLSAPLLPKTKKWHSVIALLMACVPSPIPCSVHPLTCPSRSLVLLSMSTPPALLPPHPLMLPEEPLACNSILTSHFLYHHTCSVLVDTFHHFILSKLSMCFCVGRSSLLLQPPHVALWVVLTDGQGCV